LLLLVYPSKEFEFILDDGDGRRRKGAIGSGFVQLGHNTFFEVPDVFLVLHEVCGTMATPHRTEDLAGMLSHGRNSHFVT
jgi:hypothetical protein